MEEVNPAAENVEEEAPVQSIRTRKIVRNPKNWKTQQRKLKCQSGQEYVSRRGKLVAAKGVKSTKDCTGNCIYFCATKVTENDRQLQFKGFRTLNHTRQQDKVLRDTERYLKKRTTTDSKDSRRKYTFSYFLNHGDTRVQVCKQFYLDTFDISQKRVYNAHKKKCLLTGMASEDMRGKTTSVKISPAKKQEIIDHINSFPRVESHYCRAKTKKQYLESNLNITKMYELYEKGTKDPEKESFYRHIFCTKFNLDFHRPKSDRCGKCEKFNTAKKHGLTTHNMIEAFTKHLKLKTDMRTQKSNDLLGIIPILSFDLENVLNCPRAEIGPLFYYSKLNVYNLTAQLTFKVLDEATMTFTKVSSTYCALWTEYTSGRTGNDLASAVIKILNSVFEDHPHLKDLITWSDSCVPQNRNSIISSAILHFLQNHPEVNSITMKYSIDGHGAVQEVDNIHSAIEKVLDANEYFSPIALVALLKTVNRSNPMNIMEMKPDDFKDYKDYGTRQFNFTKIPFTKVRVIKFTQSLNVQYCAGYDEFEFLNISVQLHENQPNNSSLKLVSKPPELSDIKKKHLILMFDYMSPEDIQYYESVCKLNRALLAQLKKTTNPKSPASTHNNSKITDETQHIPPYGKRKADTKLKQQITTPSKRKAVVIPKNLKSQNHPKKKRSAQSTCLDMKAHTEITKNKNLKRGTSPKKTSSQRKILNSKKLDIKPSKKRAERSQSSAK